jgi:putative membrane protein
LPDSRWWREGEAVTEVAEKNQSLWLLTVSPVIWAAHFLLSYITASIWCAKAADPDDSFWSVRAAIIVYTVVALAGIGITGWIGYRRHSHGAASLPHDDDTPEDRRLLQELSLMRRALLILGLLALAAAWLGPLPRLAGRAFFAHMTMHMGVVALAAPLIALGVAGGRLDPVREAPKLFAPVPASMLELVVVWAWHAPALHMAARHDAAALVVEQGMFLLSGLFVWLSAFGGDSPRGRSRSAAGVVGLLLTSMHMTLLGALLALSPRPLYTHAEGLAGLAPLEDQHLGGAIMLIAGGVSYLAGGLWLIVGLLRASAPAAREAA